MRKVKFQIKPTILLFPSRLDDVEKLNSEEGDIVPYSVQVRPASEFAYDNAKRKLIALRIGEENGPVVNVPTDMHDVAGEDQMRGNLLRLVAWINTDSRITVGCAGAVLSCLQRKKAAGMYGNDVNERLQIGSIEMFSMADVMCVNLFYDGEVLTGVRFVNADTVCGLQIFESESHPNFHMQGRGGRGKEGLSLFGKQCFVLICRSLSINGSGIMNSTRSPLGHRMLKQWFLHPSLLLEVINERHDSIAVFLRPDNSHILESVGKSLKKVKNIPKVLRQLKRGNGSGHKGGEWSAIVQFVFNALKIQTAMQELSGARRLLIYNKVCLSHLKPSNKFQLFVFRSWRALPALTFRILARRSSTLLISKSPQCSIE